MIGHINDLVSSMMETHVVYMAELIRFRDIANETANRYDSLLRENEKLKAEMTAIAEKIKSGEGKFAKEAIVELGDTLSANPDISKPS